MSIYNLNDVSAVEGKSKLPFNPIASRRNCVTGKQNSSPHRGGQPPPAKKPKASLASKWWFGGDNNNKKTEIFPITTRPDFPISWHKRHAIQSSDTNIHIKQVILEACLMW